MAENISRDDIGGHAMEKRYVSATISILGQMLIKPAICTTSRSSQDQRSSTSWTSIDTASVKISHLSVDELTRDVEHFASAHGMAAVAPTLIKGALIARDPPAFRNVPNLTARETEAVENEVLHKWRQPIALYLTVALCSIGAAVQGWDQTGSNGANLSFPDALGIPVGPTMPGTGLPNPNAATNQWIQGVINACPYLGAAFIGCWVSDPLNNYLGRRGAIFISAIFCCLPVIGSALAQTWVQLLVTRILLGIGMGLKGSTASVYCAENSPPNIRGGLASSWFVWTCFGIFLGTCANLAVKDTGDISWRLQLGSAFIPAVPLAVGVFFCPESPRWYLKKGRVDKAFKSLKKLRNTELQAARDLYYTYVQLEVERALVPPDGNYFTRFGQLFTQPRVRRATLGSYTVMLAQQFCGINIVAFYSGTIFVEAGSSINVALAATCGFGLIAFTFAWVAMFYIDTFGRRSLLLATFPQLFWTLLAAGCCFWIPTDSTARLGLIILFVYLFTAFYALGEGPVPFAYSAEVFPLSHREVGMSFAVATTMFWAAVLSICFPRMLGAFTPQGAFAFFAGLNLVALALIFLFVPETKNRTLEELDYIFAISSTRFIRHQTSRVLPWWFKAHVLRKRGSPCPTLYTFDGHTPGGMDQAVPGDVEKK